MTNANMCRNILCNLNMHMFNSVIDAFKKAEALEHQKKSFRSISNSFKNDENTNFSISSFTLTLWFIC